MSGDGPSDPGAPVEEPARTWFVYMVECAGDRIYTGIAVDVAARFEKHRNGRGAAFTRINEPRRVMAAKACGDQGAATREERALKKLRRDAKLAWAAQWPWVPASPGLVDAGS